MHQSSSFNLLIAGASLASVARCQSSSDDTASMTIELQRGGVDISTATAPPAEPTTVTQTSTALVSPVDVSTSTAPGTTVIVTVTGSPAPTQTDESEPDFDDAPEPSPEDLVLYQMINTCYPHDDKSVDWTAPCAAMQAIQAQCTWGPEALEFMQAHFLNNSESSFISDTWEMQPPEIQQACYCSSQWADVVVGCAKCFEAHGASKDFASTRLATSNATAMGEWSKLYCDVALKPTSESFERAMYQALGLSYDFDSMTESSTTTSSTSTLSDPLNNATAVSLYYTASVSSAYVVALPTSSSSANQSHANAWFIYSSLQTSDGMIVPTAVAAKSTNGGSQGGDATTSGSGTATEAAGALKTAMVQSGLGLGAFGVAVLAWAL